MSGHTPGPWYVRIGPPNGIAVHWSEDGQICPMRWTDGMRPEVEARVAADARLISVAPDLYDAMKVILEGFEKGIFVRNTDNDSDPMWALGIAVQIAALAKGQRAIAKAEGRA